MRWAGTTQKTNSENKRISAGNDGMAAKSRALLMICFVLWATTAGEAANPVPDKISAFVAYCAGHFADCKNKVVETDVAAMAGQLFANKADARACVVPKGVDNDAATREILTWLGKHKIADAMKTEDGIRAAEKDLWHCQLQIGDGSIPGGPPAKTGAFVAYCSTHYVKCANEIVAASVSVMVPDPPKHCSPPDTIKTKELTVAVLDWLGQHQETAGLDTDDGIAVAFDHLWPCH
jgi:hypothetical protein